MVTCKFQLQRSTSISTQTSAAPSSQCRVVRIEVNGLISLRGEFGDEINQFQQEIQRNSVFQEKAAPTMSIQPSGWSREIIRKIVHTIKEPPAYR